MSLCSQDVEVQSVYTERTSLPVDRYPNGREVIAAILEYLQVVVCDGSTSRYQWLLGRLSLMVVEPWNRCRTVVVLAGSDVGKEYFLDFLVGKVVGWHSRELEQSPACHFTFCSVEMLVESARHMLEGRSIALLWLPVSESESHRRSTYCLSSFLDGRSGLGEGKVGQRVVGESHLCHLIVDVGSVLDLPAVASDDRYVVLHCREVGGSGHGWRGERARVGDGWDDEAGLYQRLRTALETAGSGAVLRRYLEKEVPVEYREMARVVLVE